jgi:hypothetical protein
MMSNIYMCVCVCVCVFVCVCVYGGIMDVCRWKNCLDIRV